MVGNVIRAAAQRLSGAVAAEDGMSTAEYSEVSFYFRKTNDPKGASNTCGVLATTEATRYEHPQHSRVHCHPATPFVVPARPELDLHELLRPTRGARGQPPEG